MEIRKVVVIGSGTMGSGIAAHLCNAGVPVTLLDLTTEISKKARDERRHFLPMAKGRTVKSEEKAANPERRLARHTKAQTHFRKSQ